MDIQSYLSFLPSWITQEVWRSLVLIFAIGSLHHLAIVLLRRRPLGDAQKLRAPLRNSLMLFALIGLSAIWSDELHTFLVSIVAALAALVIATREVLVSVLAMVTQTFTRNPLSIGTIVRIRDVRGIVMDKSPVYTTLAEVLPGEAAPQYTGRLVSFPNSWLLTDALTQEDYTGAYAIHTVSWTTTPEMAIRAGEHMLTAAQSEYAEYRDTAKKTLKLVERERLTAVPDGTPRVSYHMLDSDKVKIMLRMAMPLNEKHVIEQRLILGLLQQVSDSVQALTRCERKPLASDMG